MALGLADRLVDLLRELRHYQQPHLSLNLFLNDPLEKCLELAAKVSPKVASREVQVNVVCVDVKSSIARVKGWDFQALTLLSDHGDIQLDVDLVELCSDSSCGYNRT